MKINMDIKPIGKVRMTQSDKWKKRPAVLKYWAFKDEIKQKSKGFKLANAYDVLFIVPFPKSYSKKKCAELLDTPHMLKPDIDNMLKALNDAFMKDDSTIHTIKASKVWGYYPAIIIENMEEI